MPGISEERYLRLVDWTGAGPCAATRPGQSRRTWHLWQERLELDVENPARGGTFALLNWEPPARQLRRYREPVSLGWGKCREVSRSGAACGGNAGSVGVTVRAAIGAFWWQACSGEKRMMRAVAVSALGSVCGTLSPAPCRPPRRQVAFDLFRRARLSSIYTAVLYYWRRMCGWRFC